MDRFDRILSSVIDSHLGLRSKLIGYQSARYPADFINLYRIRHAAKLLSTTDDPIGLIIEQSGITNRATFNRIFREHYSMSHSLLFVARPYGMLDSFKKFNVRNDTRLKKNYLCIRKAARTDEAAESRRTRGKANGRCLGKEQVLCTSGLHRSCPVIKTTRL